MAISSLTIKYAGSPTQVELTGAVSLTSADPLHIYGVTGDSGRLVMQNTAQQQALQLARAQLSSDYIRTINNITGNTDGFLCVSGDGCLHVVNGEQRTNATTDQYDDLWAPTQQPGQQQWQQWITLVDQCRACTSCSLQWQLLKQLQQLMMVAASHKDNNLHYQSHAQLCFAQDYNNQVDVPLNCQNYPDIQSFDRYRAVNLFRQYKMLVDLWNYIVLRNSSVDMDYQSQYVGTHAAIHLTLTYGKDGCTDSQSQYSRYRGNISIEQGLIRDIESSARAFLPALRYSEDLRLDFMIYKARCCILSDIKSDIRQLHVVVHDNHDMVTVGQQDQTCHVYAVMGSAQGTQNSGQLARYIDIITDVPVIGQRCRYVFQFVIIPFYVYGGDTGISDVAPITPETVRIYELPDGMFDHLTTARYMRFDSDQIFRMSSRLSTQIPQVRQVTAVDTGTGTDGVSDTNVAELQQQWKLQYTSSIVPVSPESATQVPVSSIFQNQQYMTPIVCTGVVRVPLMQLLPINKSAQIHTIGIANISVYTKDQAKDYTKGVAYSISGSNLDAQNKHYPPTTLPVIGSTPQSQLLYLYKSTQVPQVYQLYPQLVFNWQYVQCCTSRPEGQATWTRYGGYTCYQDVQNCQELVQVPQIHVGTLAQYINAMQYYYDNTQGWTTTTAESGGTPNYSPYSLQLNTGKSPIYVINTIQGYMQLKTLQMAMSQPVQAQAATDT